MKKSLQIQSSYYSALILSLHCTSLSMTVLSLPQPHVLLIKAPQTACLTLNATRRPLQRGRHCCQVASGSTSRTQTGARRSHTGSHSSLRGHHLQK